MSPKFLTALTAACIASAPCAMAQSDTKSGASGSTDASRLAKIKNGKSNTSEKTGGTTGQQGGQTDRMGGGGGKSKDSARLNLNSSRSNIY
jgi:hypothetical protein